MADKSRIEWTDATWNPVTGCTQISEGCENCYAKRHAERFRGRFGYPADEPFRVTLHEDRMGQPLRWKKPRKIFVCSMGDLFHEDVLDSVICRILDVIWHAEGHTFLILTKRPERMKKFIDTPFAPNCYGHQWPLPNLWLGVTAENQRTADERIPILLQIPAAVRFVSVEPMLGPVDISPSLDWVICGGESGPGARPMHPDWVHSLRDHCVSAGVPFFFKQWGEWSADICASNEFTAVFPEGGHGYMCGWGAIHPGAVQVWKVGKKTAGRLLDGREWNEWPEEVE